MNVMLPTKTKVFDMDAAMDNPIHVDFYDYLDTLGFDVESTELPESYDLRGSTVIGPVLDQADCGSCWSFGAS